MYLFQHGHTRKNAKFMAILRQAIEFYMNPNFFPFLSTDRRFLGRLNRRARVKIRGNSTHFMLTQEKCLEPSRKIFGLAKTLILKTHVLIPII